MILIVGSIPWLGLENAKNPVRSLSSRLQHSWISWPHMNHMAPWLVNFRKWSCQDQVKPILVIHFGIFHQPSWPKPPSRTSSNVTAITAPSHRELLGNHHAISQVTLCPKSRYPVLLNAAEDQNVFLWLRKNLQTTTSMLNVWIVGEQETKQQLERGQTETNPFIVCHERVETVDVYIVSDSTFIEWIRNKAFRFLLVILRALVSDFYSPGLCGSSCENTHAFWSCWQFQSTQMIRFLQYYSTSTYR